MAIALKVLLTLVLLVGIPCLSLIINGFLTTYLIIPDPCAYHDVDMPIFMAPFFDISASTGYHPEPSALNIITTSGIGIVLGIFAAYKYVWRVNESQQRLPTSR